MRVLNPDAYTALWNLCCTPAFLAKATDSDRGLQAVLRYRSWELYGHRRVGTAEPVKPSGYETLTWHPSPPRIADLEQTTLSTRLSCSIGAIILDQAGSVSSVSAGGQSMSMARFVAHLKARWMPLVWAFSVLLLATSALVNHFARTGPSEFADLAGSEVEFALAACEGRIRQAQVAFQTVRTMQVGRVELVTVKASVASDAPELKGATNTTIEELLVRCFLQARLRGSKFAIDPPEFRAQSFLDQSTVSWIWEVEPKETGTLRLTLEVQSLVTQRDQPAAAAEFTREIRVEAEERSILEIANDVAVAVVTHPVVQFFGASAVLGGTAYIWRRGRRKRRSAEPGHGPS